MFVRYNKIDARETIGLEMVFLFQGLARVT